jgi:hypothetical protein
MDEFDPRPALRPVATPPGPKRLGPTNGSGHASGQPAKSKPSAAAMRVALGSGGLAILSAIAAAVVAPPRPVVAPPPDSTRAVPDATGTPVAVQQPVQYIQLLPGQTAPPGAIVIEPSAPTPMVVVTTIPAPPQKPIIIKTTQSGKVVP